MTQNPKAALSVEQIDAQIVEHQVALDQLAAQRRQAQRQLAGSPAVGDQVIFCREDHVGKVDEYDAHIAALYDDLSADLTVNYLYGPMSVPHCRFDPGGAPSSWHPRRGR
jgi:hypothetical protein